MKVFAHFESRDNCTNKCSVSLHAVDGQGTILWASLGVQSMGGDKEIPRH
jgi:hypothetical protein